MATGSFLSGLLQGGVAQASKMENDDGKGGRKKGLLRRKKKPKAVPGDPGELSSFKRGGKVKRTGLSRVHKGERVLTAKQAKRYRSSKGR